MGVQRKAQWQAVKDLSRVAEQDSWWLWMKALKSVNKSVRMVARQHVSGV